MDVVLRHALQSAIKRDEDDRSARERVDAAVVLVALRGGEPEWLAIRKARELVPYRSGGEARQLVAAWCALICEVGAALLDEEASRFAIKGAHLSDSKWRLSRVSALKRSDARTLSDGIRAALPTLFRACNITIDWWGAS